MQEFIALGLGVLVSGFNVDVQRIVPVGASYANLKLVVGYLA